MSEFVFCGCGHDDGSDLLVYKGKKGCPLCGCEGVVTVMVWAERYLATFSCMRHYNDGFHNLQIACEGDSATAARAGLESKIVEYLSVKRRIEPDARLLIDLLRENGVDTGFST